MSRTNTHFDLNACEADYCPCGSPYFKPRTIIKRVPAIMAGALSDQIVNCEFMACERCGRPHRDTKFDVPKMKQSDGDVPKTKQPGSADAPTPSA